MPLIDKTGFIVDRWVRVEDEASSHAHSIIMPFSQLEELFAHAQVSPSPFMGEGASKRRERGIDVPNTVNIAELTPYFSQLALISINFPSFSDGRGFSIARALSNAGFTGEIRAFGPLIADQYAFALSCGFDTIEIPETLAERQPEEQWKAAFASISNSYQRGYKHGDNILDQRRVGVHNPCSI